MTKTKWIIILIVIILFGILLIQNRQVVDFRLYFWKVSISQVILVPMLLLIGLVTGFLLAKFRKDSNKTQIK